MMIKPKRYHSVDLLRGAIMVIMAIDHVRVYSGIPANSTDPAIFFTRWITHFCVSGFVFFAGASAFLFGEKLNDKRALSGFLITRGIFLVVLELTLLRFCWTFNLNFGQFMLAGVIWMLGWCMVLLAGAIWLPFRSIWIIGLLIIAGEQVFGLAPASVHWWNFFYPIDYDGIKWISILYVLLPWIGVMMAGYGFGRILQMEAARRRKICLTIGLSAIAVFVIIGTLLIVTGDPKPRPFHLSFAGPAEIPAITTVPADDAGPDHRTGAFRRASRRLACPRAVNFRAGSFILLYRSYPADPCSCAAGQPAEDRQYAPGRGMRQRPIQRYPRTCGGAYLCYTWYLF
jgi:uncharacterized membrane protein